MGVPAGLASDRNGAGGAQVSRSTETLEWKLPVSPFFHLSAWPRGGEEVLQGTSHKVSLTLPEPPVLISPRGVAADDPTGLAQLPPDTSVFGRRSEQNAWNANPNPKEGQEALHGTLA